jgi:hypothetical protein
MESKYGRLFTAEDVEKILLHTEAAADVTAAHEVRRAAELWLDRHAEKRDGEGRETRYRLTFPPDEPLFLLRGSDEAMPRVMRAGFADGIRNGALPTDQAIEEELAEIRAVEDWQAEHPDRVKLPH